MDILQTERQIWIKFFKNTYMLILKSRCLNPIQPENNIIMMICYLIWYYKICIAKIWLLIPILDAKRIIYVSTFETSNFYSFYNLIIIISS